MTRVFRRHLFLALSSVAGVFIVAADIYAQSDALYYQGKTIES